MEKMDTIKAETRRNLYNLYSKNLNKINKNIIAYIGNPTIELFVLNPKELFLKPFVLNKNLFNIISNLNNKHNPNKVFIYASFGNSPQIEQGEGYHIKEMMSSQDLINELTNKKYKELSGKTKIRWVYSFPEFIFYEEERKIGAECDCINGFLREYFIQSIPEVKKLYKERENLNKILCEEDEKYGKCNPKLDKESENLFGFLTHLELWFNIGDNVHNTIYPEEESEICSKCGICCYLHGPSVEISNKDVKTIEKEIKKLPKNIQEEIKLKAGSLEDFWINAGKGKKLIPIVEDEDVFLTNKLGRDKDSEETHPCVFLAFPYKNINIPLKRIGKCNIYKIRKKLNVELCNTHKCSAPFPRWTVKEHFKGFPKK